MEGMDGQITKADIISAFRFDFLDKIEAKTTEEETPVQEKSNGSYPTPAKPSSNYRPSSKPEELSSYIEYDDPKDSPISPYHNKVKISTIRKERNDNPSYIKLRVSTKEEINLTGFVLKTRHGEFVIPKGVERYKSNQTERNIVIEENSYIYLVNDSSPIRADAFRINNCFGYLADYDDIYPRTRCSYSYVKPEKEDLYHLHPVCQEYILDLRQYEIPNYSNNLSVATKSSCVSYLNDNFNYSGCYRNHYKDENFFKDYWYVYTNSKLIEPLHDIIYLYDRNGYLVNTYSY